MDDEKIQAVTYCGHKANERPTAFVFNNEEIKVSEILDMWIEDNVVDKQRKRFFIIKDHAGYIYTIFMHEKTGEWFLRKRPGKHDK
jgi:hypothetical protein